MALCGALPSLPEQGTGKGWKERMLFTHTQPLLTEEALEIFRPRVHAGLAFTRVHMKKCGRSCLFTGWESRISLASLNIASSLHCFLGQATGSYVTGLHHLGLAFTGRATGLGFLGCAARSVEGCVYTTSERACEPAREQIQALPYWRDLAPVELLTATWRHELSLTA